MQNKSALKRIGTILIDFIEIWIPVAVFVGLFLAFLINVIFRYLFNNPQNWTFEFSILSFVIVGLLGACAAYRTEDHVVFDLLYDHLGEKGRNILRMTGYITVIILFTVAMPATIRYVIRLPAKSSIMEIPLKYIFVSLPILYVSTILRSIHRLILDLKAFKNKTYLQTYNLEPKDRLI